MTGRLHLGLLILLALAGVARADGGAVVGQATSDSLSLTVFAAPVPLRAGLVDVSVLLQSIDDDRAILDAVVNVRLHAGARVLETARATHAGATNKILYAAQVEIPAPGAWELEIRAEHDGRTIETRALLEAAPGLAPASRFWVWLVLPVVVVAVFLLHQWLGERA